MTHDEMIAVIAAHRDGKKIQFRRKSDDSDWTIARDNIYAMEWNFDIYEYRIAPSPPKPREFRVYLWNGVEPTGVFGEGDVRIPAASKEAATRHGAELIHVREVLPET